MRVISTIGTIYKCESCGKEQAPIGNIGALNMYDPKAVCVCGGEYKSFSKGRFCK
jgi:DNA-directed RNA polymerase subunit RPC12/RpoP